MCLFSSKFFIFLKDTNLDFLKLLFRKFQMVKKQSTTYILGGQNIVKPKQSSQYENLNSFLIVGAALHASFLLVTFHKYTTYRVDRFISAVRWEIFFLIFFQYIIIDDNLKIFTT